MARRLNRGSAVVAFLAGAAITLTFMMCSAAPYFVAVSLISEVVEGAARLLYILAYNVVVVLPLAAVALGAVKLSDALASRGHVHLLRGAVLMAVGAYALHAFF
ncbi:MAG TPA: hypothetical protein EYP90_12110 [Chromatiaceae bacterium]|nr:hypothetical protein [Chromatiaceae bacterium]